MTADGQRGLTWAAGLVLGAFTVLWLARWPTFPLVLDPYYHLLIARQVADAGGPIAYEWWEYAPMGRPHLYPPILHLLLAALLKIGCAPLTAIRLVSAVLPPALLLSSWLVMRRLCGAPAALAVVLAGVMPFAFHLHSAITLAATLAMIELLWLVAALESGRPLAAGWLLGLLSYTHLGLPWVALLTVAAGWWLRPSRRPTIRRALWGLLLALPWALHLWRHHAAFLVLPRYENQQLDVLLLLYAAAGIGLWKGWRGGTAARWLLALWVGFSPLAVHHRYRWLSGEGMLPVLLLAGLGVAACGGWLAQRAATGPAVPRRQAVGLAICGLVLALSPSILQAPAGWRWPDAAPWHLLRSPMVTPKETDTSFYGPQIDRLVQAVVQHTGPAEILWSNAPYALGLVAALAHRPMSSAMLNEVRPPAAVHPLRSAQAVLWFKLSQPSGSAEAPALQALGLRPVAEDDVAILLRRQEPVPAARPPRAVLPLGAALALLGLAVGRIVWDLRKPRHRTPLPV